MTTPGYVPPSAYAELPWWEVFYTVITGGGRSAYESGSGVMVVQAQTAAAAAAIVTSRVPGAKVSGNTKGPFTTAAAAQASAAADKAAQAAGTETSTGATGTSNNPKTNVSIPNPLAALASIAKFFEDLTNKNLWLRVAKVVVGAGLLIAGIAKLTGTEEKVLGMARAAKTAVTA